MAHPDWALKHKKPGTELRHIKGKYYLYKISSKWDKEKKVTRKITECYLGRITEDDGFLPKGSQSINKSRSKKISVKEYGASSYILSLTCDIQDGLKKSFPDCYQELLAMAINRLLHRSALKNMEFFYDESVLSDLKPDLKLSKNDITILLQNVGQDKGSISKFLDNFVTGHEHIVFDTTHVVSNSKHITGNHVGYNSQGSYDPQVNLLYMFSTDKQMPVIYRLFPGNITGMKALKLALKGSNLKDCMLVGDKGFASRGNIETLENENYQYIIPLKRNDSLIDCSKLKSRSYDKAFDGHFFYKNRTIFYFSKKIASSKRRVMTFFDPKLQAEEEASYLRRVRDDVEGYSLEKYKKKQLSFGTLSMITNNEKNEAETIYVKYKARMEIETLFDTYKNLLHADRTYMHSDNAMEAWMLINHIAIMMYYKVFNVIRGGDLSGKFTPEDLLTRLSHVRKIKIRDQWYLNEVNAKSQKLFESLNIAVT